MNDATCGAAMTGRGVRGPWSTTRWQATKWARLEQGRRNRDVIDASEGLYLADIPEAGGHDDGLDAVLFVVPARQMHRVSVWGRRSLRPLMQASGLDCRWTVRCLDSEATAPASERCDSVQKQRMCEQR